MIAGIEELVYACRQPPEGTGSINKRGDHISPNFHDSNGLAPLSSDEYLCMFFEPAQATLT
jgi:hypothetical protein